MTTEPNSQEKLSLFELRLRQHKKTKASGQNDPYVEDRRQWLNDLGNQRQYLFDALHELTEFDDEQYQRAIKAVQERGEGDEEGFNNTSWTVANVDDLSGLIIRNTWACLKQVAMLDLTIKQLEEQLYTAVKYQAAPESLRSLLLLPTKVEQSAPSLLEIMAHGYQLLGAIKILQHRENFVRDRRRGSAGGNREPKKSETQHLITTMTKMLYQADPPKNARATENNLTNRYVEKILDIWADWPFFPLKSEELAVQVGQALKALDLPFEKKKVLFKRRMITTMARPRRKHDIPFITETESFARECEARQAGIADALVQVMESKFGELNIEDKAKIERSSPEQLGIWLRNVHDAIKINDLLSQADQMEKNIKC
mgnify:CR=1 FL=1|nr:hypothetical protein [Halomonas sp. UBA3074]